MKILNSVDLLRDKVREIEMKRQQMRDELIYHRECQMYELLMEWIKILVEKYRMYQSGMNVMEKIDFAYYDTTLREPFPPGNWRRRDGSVSVSGSEQGKEEIVESVEEGEIEDDDGEEEEDKEDEGEEEEDGEKNKKRRRRRIDCVDGKTKGRIEE